MILILGAGLAGLSCSYHLGHERCLILEKKARAFGHIGSERREGFTWDPGPHVSFTKHDYVRELFAESVAGEFDEYEVATGNYFQGHWIDHPAQSSLYQVPEPLRGQCLESFLHTRATVGREERQAANYMEWLERAFGPVFARTFPAAYTRKYWTRDPRDMTTDWVGQRVFYPNVEDVVAGGKEPLERKTHYITKVRYPRRGGYQSFAAKLAAGANIHYGADVVSVDLDGRKVWTADGNTYDYDVLINTLPLPMFIHACQQLPPKVREAAIALSCSQLLLVNVIAPHVTQRPENWLYVYDEDKLSTRIHCTEKLTPGNAPEGWTGIQVEVYFSRHRPLNLASSEVGERIVQELVEMALIDPNACTSVTDIRYHTRYCPWANVIFDHDTRPALNTIWRWLETKGLVREDDDLLPLTDWATSRQKASGRLAMAGRFGQWKYYWTDDCVLRGRLLSCLK